MSAARAGLCSVLLAAASWATPAGFSGRALPAAVYGEDGRGDPDGVLDQGRLEAVESTVALFPADSVHIDRQRGEAVLETAPYVSTDRGKPLCPDERFYGQPSGAFCTGFLVAPDAILTAGHCLRQFECSGMKVVFGFAAGKTGQQPGIVPDGEVYGCAEGLLGARGRGGDWALIRLDRAVRDHGVLRLNGSDD
ncbi:MAG: trypsin-like serine protease, partial [Elusimicrobia bacterium]|nr:trypsin-like serine protease [Elusimicrobiota bacterium]